MIKLVDVFAGPGGLGEGFARYRDPQRQPRFELAVSMERDATAHKTLRLRAFRRQFGRAPSDYFRFLRGETDWSRLAEHHPHQARAADSEAKQIELGEATVQVVRDLIDERLGGAEEWVLIGGPPCQAYSLAGRSRNAGRNDYRPEDDKRQTLYVEYLQILGNHAPPVFVMENVKGLLSAELQNTRMFDLILHDLSDPAKALKREGRKARTGHVRYVVRPVVQPLDRFGIAPGSYVVRAEQFGIPQRRHRVILLGVREDVSRKPISWLVPGLTEVGASSVLERLPRVRSGLSKVADSSGDWLAALKNFRRAEWVSEVDSDVRHAVRNAIAQMRAPRVGRGAEYLSGRFGLVLNHSTRGHIVEDLARYVFASAFASVRKESPRLKDFPRSLLPNHGNVEEALGHGLFSDRFRVQLGDAPSTTITSHIAKDGHYYIHPDPTQARSLTVREAAGLQTFPDDYFFCGPRTAQYHQVGNAVPPALATRIAGIVAELF